MGGGKTVLRKRRNMLNDVIESIGKTDWKGIKVSEM